MLLYWTVLGFPSCVCPLTPFGLALTFLLKLLLCGALVEWFWLQSRGLYSDFPPPWFPPCVCYQQQSPSSRASLLPCLLSLVSQVHLSPSSYLWTWDSVGSWGPFPLLFPASALFLSWCQPHTLANSSCHGRVTLVPFRAPSVLHLDHVL